MEKKQRPVDGRHGLGWIRRTVWGILVVFFLLSAGGAALGQGVSLKTSDEPLQNVLADLARATGKKLFCDEAWADLPITVQFKNLPLETALKRILANLNHAIIYQTDDTILIRIYENAAPAGESAAETGGAVFPAESPSGHEAMDVSVPEEQNLSAVEGDQAEAEAPEVEEKEAAEASEETAEPEDKPESEEPAEDVTEPEKTEESSDTEEGAAETEAPEAAADDAAESSEPAEG